MRHNTSSRRSSFSGPGPFLGGLLRQDEFRVVYVAVVVFVIFGQYGVNHVGELVILEDLVLHWGRLPGAVSLVVGLV